MFIHFIVIFLIALFAPYSVKADMQDMPVAKLQTLDKITARTMTFEMSVGKTVKFGPIYIKAQSCRKSEPTDKPEAAAFLQIWEVPPKKEPRWVFSGWMYASSPAVSSMEHPVYDVWVIDCLEKSEKDDGKNISEPPK